jgi:ABC-type nitrate/sulfonate/bicarbonate transport system ATPase subunit
MNQHDTIRGAEVDIKAVSHDFQLDGRRLPVLENISIKVGGGEFLSLLGPSGCGKSTLLRLIAGLELPTSGTITSNGKAIASPDPSRILAFQDATLFPWATVWKNVATGLEARGELKGREHIVNDALALVKLEAFAKAYPHQLSGGMAQRAALARALVNNPEVLLLDEPFGRLDSLTRMVLQDELATIWQRSKFTALLVTHDVEEAILLSERVIVLSDRPAQVVETFAVDLPFPRHRDDARIVELRTVILATLGLGATVQDAAA